MDDVVDRTAQPTERADLEIWVSPDRGLGLTSKAKTARTAAVLGIVIAIVALPILLLQAQAQNALPSSTFIFSDALGTVALFVLAIVILRGPGNGGSMK